MYYHEAKSLCVASFDVLVVFSRNAWFKSFVPGEQQASGFSVFLLSFIQFTWNPFSHLLDYSHDFQTDVDGFSCVHLIDPRVVLAFERHPHPTMLAIRRLKSFR